MKKRDNAIDFFRGLIAVHILMIHTVFHSGDIYVPRNVQNWFLLFDVPIFLLLSGMSYSFHENPRKKLKEILRILFQYAIFITFVFIFLLIVDKSHIFIKDFPSWLVFKIPPNSSVYTLSLEYSVWFMPPFIQSSILSAIILYILKKSFNDDNTYLKSVLMLLIFFGFLLVSTNFGIVYFDLEIQTISFSFFYLLGYLSMKYKFKNFRTFLLSEMIIITLLLLSFHFNSFSITDIQMLKGQMNYIYILFSLIGILLIIYLKNKFLFNKKIFKPINFIGKNALCLYFAQGISSSILFLIEPKLNIKYLYLKILTLFSINIIIALSIFFILIFTYKIIETFLKQLKNFKIIEKIKNDY